MQWRVTFWPTPRQESNHLYSTAAWTYQSSHQDDGSEDRDMLAIACVHPTPVFWYIQSYCMHLTCRVMGHTAPLVDSHSSMVDFSNTTPACRHTNHGQIRVSPTAWIDVHQTTSSIKLYLPEVRDRNGSFITCPLIAHKNSLGMAESLSRFVTSRPKTDKIHKSYTANITQRITDALQSTS